MKTYNLIVGSLICIAITGAHPSFAGTETHGGGAFGCVDASGHVLNAAMQDLWEAANVDHLQLIDSRSDEKTLSREIIKRIQPLSPLLYARVADELDWVLKNREILPDVGIEEIKDDERLFEKTSCDQGEPKFVQAAAYIDEKLVSGQKIKLAEPRLVYSEPVWQALGDNRSSVGQAALNVHEALYRVFRKVYGDTTSTRTRGVVGVLFSNADETRLVQVLPPNRFDPSRGDAFEKQLKDLESQRRLEELEELKWHYENAHKPTADELVPSGNRQEWTCTDYPADGSKRPDKYYLISDHFYPFYARRVEFFTHKKEANGQWVRELEYGRHLTHFKVWFIFVPVTEVFEVALHSKGAPEPDRGVVGVYTYGFLQSGNLDDHGPYPGLFYISYRIDDYGDLYYSAFDHETPDKPLLYAFCKKK